MANIHVHVMLMYSSIFCASHVAVQEIYENGKTSRQKLLKPLGSSFNVVDLSCPRHKVFVETIEPYVDALSVEEVVRLFSAVFTKSALAPIRFL